MRGVSIIITAQGRITEQEWNVDVPTLGFLRAAVDGSIELIPGFDQYHKRPCVAYCNEDGERLEMFSNPKAQTLWKASGVVGAGLAMTDVLVGDIVILTGDEAWMEAL